MTRGKPYCGECGTLREYCDCDLYDALAEDDELLEENLAAQGIEARQRQDPQGLDAKHDSPVPLGMRPTPRSTTPKQEGPSV